MTKRSIVRLVAVAGALAALIILGLVISRAGARDGPALPALTRYEHLPEAFNTDLRRARQDARSPEADAASIRKLAQLYQANRFLPEARQCYGVIAAIPPGLTAKDHYHLALIAQSESDLGQAQAELRAVLKAEPGYAPARVALADCLFKTGQEAEAAREYSAVIESAPDNLSAALGLARIDLQRGDDDSAAMRLEDLLNNHPEATTGAALFAQVLERRGDAERAAAMVEWSRQKPEPVPPDPWKSELHASIYDIQSLALLFEDYLKTGQAAEAMPWLRRIEELDPRSSLPHLLRGRAEEQAHHEAAAAQHFRLALAQGGDPEAICPRLVQCLLAVGDVGEARKLMADHHARMPDSMAIAKAYADVALRAGDDKLARSLLTIVLRHDPHLFPQNMSLARILWTAGERDEAVKCLRRAAQASPRDVASRALLGEYYLGKADPVSALGPLEEANARVAAQTPAHGQIQAMLHAAYVQTGRHEAERGDLAGAANYFEKAIQVAPTDLNGYAGKAQVCAQLGQFRRAADALGKMASLDPKNPTIQLSLGDVLYQGGESEAARRSWQAALRLTPAHDSGLRAVLGQRLSGNITPETFK